ncbi:MAG TPA: GNAT family protein [Gemmatimonadaceae bacterium]
MPLAPSDLRGSIVSLEPLTLEHAPALAQVGLEPDLWRLQPRTIESLADMHDYIALALAEQERGASLPFVIVRHADRAIIGSTRYMDIALPHRRLEIGSTWLAPAAQRTGANVEAKYLLLAHAFDVLGMQKVVLKTEVLNTQSRNAILALGATEEGIFRKQFISASGRARDMIYFAILDSEWPAVRARLEQRLARHTRS